MSVRKGWLDVVMTGSLRGVEFAALKRGFDFGLASRRRHGRLPIELGPANDRPPLGITISAGIVERKRGLRPALGLGYHFSRDRKIHATRGQAYLKQPEIFAPASAILTV